MSTILPELRRMDVGRLFQGYVPSPGQYDEWFSGPGAPRGHYRTALSALTELGADELARRVEQAQRIIRENGTTYNAYGDPQAAPRPWNLDLCPVVLAAEEWRELAAGLAQRVRLLNAVLADVYGPQRLLQRGLLPAELLFAHPGFYRQFHGLGGTARASICWYAADLARRSDGRWHVVADRTDAPQGAGYTLENRIVVSRLLPGIMHECRVERLAAFFLALQDTLRQNAPQHRDNPRIVLISQGPSSPNYFEDAYLSRYLGYTLVEAGDLTVRNERVLLKTLGGLLPVDVILRRQSDLHCDPLELRGAPMMGVAGLLQAVRAGNVAVANSLGASLVESPAFLPYLPRLCRALLDEDLQLPFVPTWWCGDEPSLAYVLDHLDDLVIRSAFRFGRLPVVPGEELERLPLDQRAAAIRAAPQRYIARQRLEHSGTPVFEAGQWRAASVALRAYVVADGERATALPGGLLRVARDPALLEWSILAGDGSKDAWVLSTGPVGEITLLQPPGAVTELRRTGAELPSRVADNLFWLGRYVERADGATRLLRTAVTRLAGELAASEQPALDALLRCLAAQGQIEPGFVVEGIRQQLPRIEEMLPAAALDARQPTSLAATLASMYRIASLVRDRISIDSWRILTSIDRDLQPWAARGKVEPAELLTFVNRIVIDLAAFSGLVAESTTRTQGWRFLEMGRRIERSLLIIELVRNVLADKSRGEPAVLEAILEVADSIMTYRSRYLANLQLAPTLDLLLTDETNPRSLAHQLAALNHHVEQLPRDHTQALRSPEQRIAVSALTAIRLIDWEVLSERPRSGERSRLERILERLAEQLPKLSDMVSHKYLVHSGSPRQLADSGRERMP